MEAEVQRILHGRMMAGAPGGAQVIWSRWRDSAHPRQDHRHGGVSIPSPLGLPVSQVLRNCNQAVVSSVAMLQSVFVFAGSSGARGSDHFPYSQSAQPICGNVAEPPASGYWRGCSRFALGISADAPAPSR